MISSIKLYLDNSYSSKVKPYTLAFENSGKVLKITVPKDRSTTHMVDIHYFDTDTFEETKTLTDVRETIK